MFNAFLLSVNSTHLNEIETKARQWLENVYAPKHLEISTDAIQKLWNYHIDLDNKNAATDIELTILIKIYKDCSLANRIKENCAENRKLFYEAIGKAFPKPSSFCIKILQSKF